MSAKSAEAAVEAFSTGDAAPQISIIVPTRNEADNIDPLIERVAAAMDGFHFELLFVDDSTDDTPQQVRRAGLQASFPVRLIARPPERRNGLSGAVVEGFSAAHGEWVCVMDADLQHPPETIPLMWDQARKSRADIVVGSRRGDLFGPLGLTRLRSLNSKVLTILARMLFPRLLKNVSDPLTGLFLVRRSAVEIDLLRPDGFKILLEILVRCPPLHVTEIHFDFAPRNQGESKADFREGIRFFRHLLRLRLTVNPHLYRFLIAAFLGFVANSAFLYLMHERGGVNIWLAAVIAAEALALWNFLLFTFWVFNERERKTIRRRFWGEFFLTQLFLFLIHLPLMWIMIANGLLGYLPANILGLLVVGLVRYGFSERWVWTKGSMVWQPPVYFYNLHDILIIESQVPLLELAFFAGSAPEGSVDIQIRLDRQGTPSHIPGGINYDEQLGRFGFGLSVLPGEFTQVVVSPLLQNSPSFLFTNLVEPLIRWNLVRKDFAFIKAAAAAKSGEAVIIHGAPDMGRVMAALCAGYGYDFLADDLTIVDGHGRAYAYPKPVTVMEPMLVDGRRPAGFQRSLALRARRFLYTPQLRRIGLWLDARELPAASLNMYLQWLVPQPKFMLGDTVAGLTYGAQAALTRAVSLSPPGSGAHSPAGDDLLAQLQPDPTAAGFQPHPLLADRLRYWQDVDLLQKERTIIEEALRTAVWRRFQPTGENWWQDVAAGIAQDRLAAPLVTKSGSSQLTLSLSSKPVGRA